MEDVAKANGGLRTAFHRSFDDGDEVFVAEDGGRGVGDEVERVVYIGGGHLLCLRRSRGNYYYYSYGRRRGKHMQGRAAEREKGDVNIRPICRESTGGWLVVNKRSKFLHTQSSVTPLNLSQYDMSLICVCT